MKPGVASCCQVEDAAERLGDSSPNPHGGCEDDLFIRMTAVCLRNTSADTLQTYVAVLSFSSCLLFLETGPTAPFSTLVPSWLSPLITRPASPSSSRRKEPPATEMDRPSHQAPLLQIPVSRTLEAFFSMIEPPLTRWFHQNLLHNRRCLHKKEQD